jgi:hypothetical protein
MSFFKARIFGLTKKDSTLLLLPMIYIFSHHQLAIRLRLLVNWHSKVHQLFVLEDWHYQPPQTKYEPSNESSLMASNIRITYKERYLTMLIGGGSFIEK